MSLMELEFLFWVEFDRYVRLEEMSVWCFLILAVVGYRPAMLLSCYKSFII